MICFPPDSNLENPSFIFSLSTSITQSTFSAGCYGYSATILGISGFPPKHSILSSNASVSKEKELNFFKGLRLSHLIFFHLQYILEETYRKITFIVTNIWKLRAWKDYRKLKMKNPPIYKTQICRGNKEHKSAWQSFELGIKILDVVAIYGNNIFIQ